MIVNVYKWIILTILIFFGQIVNGPEVLSKYVGETEKNVRDLFADAENEQKSRGMECFYLSKYIETNTNNTK